MLLQDPPLPGTPLEGGSKKKERSSKTSASGKNLSADEAEHARRKGFDQIPTDPAGIVCALAASSPDVPTWPLVALPSLPQRNLSDFPKSVDV